METETVRQQPEVAPEQPRKSSGYRRLQRRHHELIAERDTLLAENAVLTYQQRDLQEDIDRLLAEHQRLIQNVKSAGPQQPWFESANQILAQLAAAPEPRALQVMTAALAGLQQRLAQIIMRVPVP